MTYSLDGEVKTHKGSYQCSFIGHDGNDDPTLRLYDGVYKVDGNVSESSWLYTDAYVEHVTSGVFGGPDSKNDNKPMINEQFVFT